MPRAPGQLIASGRDADVFDIGRGSVLRRYRKDHSSEDEASVMEFARSRGFPVPKVREAKGRDLVMERIEGPTMLRELAARPWKLLRCADVLADLHDSLHRIDAPHRLRSPFGDGPSLLHLDLHPENVIMSRNGPLVIDWTNAARGPATIDVALTWIIVATSVIPGPRLQRTVGAVGRGIFLKRFLSSFERKSVAQDLARVGAFRAGDPNVMGREREAIFDLIRDHHT